MNDAERYEALRERYLRLRVAAQRVVDAASSDGEDARVYVNQLCDLKRELAAKPQPHGLTPRDSLGEAGGCLKRSVGRPRRDTPTDTPTKKGRHDHSNEVEKTALGELKDLESKRQKAADAATDLGRQLFEARKRLYGHLDDRGLVDTRVRLMDREPDQYNPDGSARRKDSAAGRLEAEINKTPDLAVLAQKVEHARRLEKRAKEELDAHVRENIDAILEGLQAEAERQPRR
jgi:hypothetical protein